MSDKDITRSLNSWVPRWLRKMGYDLVIAEVTGPDERADFMGFGVTGATRLVEVKSSIRDVRDNLSKPSHRAPQIVSVGSRESMRQDCLLGDERWLATTAEVARLMNKDDIDAWRQHGWGIVSFSGYGWESYETVLRAEPRNRPNRRADVAALVRMIKRGDYRHRASWSANSRDSAEETP